MIIVEEFNILLILLQFSTYFLSTRSQLLTGNCVEALETYIQLVRQIYPGIVLPPFEIHECRYGPQRFLTAIRQGLTGRLLGRDICNIPLTDLSPNDMGGQKRTSILLPRVPPGGLKIDTPRIDTSMGAAYTNAEYSALNSDRAFAAPFQSTSDYVGQALKKEQVTSHQSATNRFQTSNTLTHHTGETNQQHLQESSMNQIMNHGGTMKAGPAFGGSSARLIQPGLASSLQQRGLYSDYNSGIALKQMLANGVYDTRSPALGRPYGGYEGNTGYGLGANSFYGQNQKLATASSGGTMLVNNGGSQAEMAYLQQRKLQDDKIQHQIQNELQQEAIQQYQQSQANHVYAENKKLATAYSGGSILANQAGMGHLQHNPMQQETIRQHQQNEASHVYAENQKVAAAGLTTNQMKTQAIMGQIQQEKMREEILHQQQEKLQHLSVQNHQQSGQNDGPMGFYLLGGEVKGENNHAGGVVAGNGVQTAAFGSTSVQHQSYASGQVHHERAAGVQGLEVIQPGGVREVVKGGQKVLISNTECPDKSELCITIDS